MALTKIGATLGGSADVITVTQNNHGLLVGRPVRMTSNGYAYATANTAPNAEAIGIIIAVTTNTLTIALGGRVTVDDCVPSGDPGTVLFLQPTHGLLHADEPSEAGQISKPMAVITVDGSEMVMVQQRGEVISTGGASIADGSITLAKMAVNSIDSDQYVDGSIDLAHMSANSIDSDQYVDGSIDSIHLADSSVTAQKISSGAVGTSQLATNQVNEERLQISNAGTNGQFLQKQSGNSGGLTWAAVSAGISGHGTVVIKSSDQTVNNSTTLVNDDTLVWALAANKNYRLWAHAFIDTHIHSDFKWTFTGPSGCEIHLTVNRNYAAGASYDWHGLNSLGTVVSMGTPSDTASNWYWFGTIMNGGNAGNLQLQWAQNAAQSFDTKMHNGSWGIVELLN